MQRWRLNFVTGDACWEADTERESTNTKRQGTDKSANGHRRITHQFALSKEAC